MNLWKCGCGALNESSDLQCEACGLAVPAASAALPTSTRMTCPVDRAAINRGFCMRGQGYPMTEVCPFSCPICRKPLQWSGACYECFGTTTGRREDWSFPGDHFELQEGHWVKVAEGARRACTQAENKAGARDLLRALAGSALAAKVPAAPVEEVPF